MKLNYSNYYIVILLLLGLLHIVIGSSLILILNFIIISVTGWFFLKLNNIRFSNLFIFLFSMYYGFLNLLIKALLFQKLQSNLIYPFESGFIVLIGFFCICLAGILSQIVIGDKSSRLNKIFENKNFINNGIIPFLILGFIFRFLHLYSTNEVYVEGGEAFGGFGTFKFILIFGFILLYKKYSENMDDFYGKIIIFCSFLVVILAIITNTKKDIFDFVFLSGFCIYFFKIKLNFKLVSFVGLIVILVVMFLSPVIHLMRDDYNKETIGERIEKMYAILSENNFSPVSLYAAEGAYMEGFTYSYGENNSYIYPSKLNLDRFLLIFTVDQITREINNNNYIGFDVLGKEVKEAVLPSVFVDKDPQIATDIIAWKYGIRANGSVARPVLGYIATSSAIGGIYTVILFPLIELFLFFCFMNYFFGEIKGRIWGVFGFILVYGYVEKGVGEYISFMLRDSLIVVLCIIFLYIIFRRKIKFY